MESSSHGYRVSRWLWCAFGLAVWITVGLVGAWGVRRAWRQAQVDEFRRSVEAVAALAGYRQWSQPWESDPAWQELEGQLGIDLVPLAALGEGSREPSSGQVHWLLSPSGQLHATVTVPLAAPTAGVGAIRGTRVISDRRADWFWWTLWTAVGMTIAALARVSIRRVQMESPWVPTELGPWREWAESIADRQPQDGLPILQHSDSPLAVRLNMLAAQYNARQEEREHAAARLQLVFGHLSEGVLAVDSQGRVIMMNSVLREQLGLGSEEFYQRPLVEVVRIPRVVDLLEHVLKTKQGNDQTVEVGTRYLRLLAAPLPQEDGEAGVLLTAIDVSATQRSELARREFIAGASHELKTPLAAIRAYTETLQAIHQEDPEAAQRFLGNILVQADRMDRLVTGMLQLARAESGALKLKLERIDAVAAIRPCLEGAIGLAQTKGIAIDAKLPSTQLLLRTDRDALQTIASNLLSNAVRYTPAGGQIELELFQEQQQVVLRVSDTGIGIAEADRERIFERFYRVQKDRSQDTGGTGLGLAIVKQLVQVLDGSVEVSGRKGEGTCFEIRLPGVGFTQSSSKSGGQSAQSR